jgi:uncharacterized membrane protein
VIVVLRIVATAILLWAVVGLAVWAWLPAGWRRPLLPAVPLLGVMALAVGLHLTGLFAGAGDGVWFVITAALLALAIRSRGTSWWLDLEEWRWPAATTLAGLAVAVVLLSPLATIGAQLIEPAGSNDGYAYTTSAEWIGDHSLLTPPDAHAAPAWRYPADVYAIGLRLGADVNQAAVSRLARVEVRESWYIVMSLWVVLIPGALLATARLLELGEGVGFIAGLMTSASAVVLGQALFSNAASLLGIAMTPFVLALIARYVHDVSRGTRSPPPLWIVAGSAAALVCTYTEVLPLVLFGAVGFALSLGRGQVWRVVGSLAKLLVAVVIVSPLGCFRAVKSFSAAVGGLDAAGGLLSPFRDQPIRVIASHLVGTRAIFDPTGTRWSYLVVALLIAGLVMSVLVSPARRFFGWHLGSIALTIGALSLSAHAAYGQGRAITVAMSLLMLAVAAGWLALYRRVVASTVSPPTRAVSGAAGLLAVAGFVAINVSTVVPYLVVGPGHYVSQLVYGQAFDTAGRYVAGVASPDGGQAMIVETGIHEQLWLRYRLREFPAVQFPYLIPLYSDRQADILPAHPARYVVAQRQAWLDADPAVVRGEDADFRYLDANAGSFMLAAGALGFHPIGGDAHGAAVQWMGDDGDLLIVHDATVHRVALTAILPLGQSPLGLTVTASGLPDQHITLHGRDTVALAVPSPEVAFLTFHNDRPAVNVPGLPWPVSFAVLEVSKA